MIPGDADTCLPGYVWREAVPGDHVCVTPAVRAQAADDNAHAAERVDPENHAFGPDTCRQGYVWREAVPGDHVCVTPAVREQTALDNALAPTRVAGGTAVSHVHPPDLAVVAAHPDADCARYVWFTVRNDGEGPAGRFRISVIGGLGTLAGIDDPGLGVGESHTMLVGAHWGESVTIIADFLNVTGDAHTANNAAVVITPPQLEPGVDCVIEE